MAGGGRGPGSRMAVDWFTEDQKRPKGALALNTVLRGRYTVGRALGGGGLAFTYAAYDQKAKRAVSVREFFPGAFARRAPDGQAVSAPDAASGAKLVAGADAFYEEAGALMGVVGCTNVAGVRDRFFENGTAYAVGDLYEGMSLTEYLRYSRRSLSPGELNWLIHGLSDGLLVVHSLGWGHGGVSGEHIFLTEEGVPVLMGFQGAAAAMEARTEGFDPREDLRALGTTLLNAYAGEGAGPEAAPKALVPVFTGLMSDDERLRFQSVFQLMHLLNAVDAPMERPVADSSLPERFRRGEEARQRLARRNLILAAVISAVVLALTAALVILLTRA